MEPHVTHPCSRASNSSRVLFRVFALAHIPRRLSTWTLSVVPNKWQGLLETPLVCFPLKPLPTLTIAHRHIRRHHVFVDIFGRKQLTCSFRSQPTYVFGRNTARCHDSSTNYSGMEIPWKINTQNVWHTCTSKADIPHQIQNTIWNR